ncbi:MAG: chloride channel protein [Prevotellaceae bacterium]|nr:chloride channel protein [Candidatus Colivivens caballi]
MKTTTFLRNEAKWLNAVTDWIKGDHTQKQIVLMLSLTVGVCSGLAAVLLKWLVDSIKVLLTQHFDLNETNGLYLIYPAIGILLAGLFVRFIVKDDISHGVTKILYAISRKRARIKRHNRWTSIIASALTIGFGGSVGAEAPIVLTGSAFGSDLGKRFHLPPNMLMLMVGCGAAGAVAAIFKAPIAGLMFVLEVLMLDLTMSSLLSLLVASLTAVCVSYALTGTQPMFDFHLEKAFTIDIIPGCILLGVACGLVSLYFTRTMNWFERIFGKMKSPWVKFVIGAIILGVLIFFFPAMYGEGYDVIRQMINEAKPDEIMHNTLFYGGGESGLLMYLGLVLLLKVFASTATNGGGGCGGVFAPSLFLGSIAGFMFASVWDATLGLSLGSACFLSPKNCALYGMAGLMSGVMHAPLTGIFLIAELTGGYDLFVPLMMVSVAAYLTIQTFEPHSIYAMRLARKGELLTHDKDQAVLTLLNLDSQIERDYKPMSTNMDLAQMVQVVVKSHRNIFPVIDQNDHLVGVITLDSIRKYMFRTELYHQYTVRSFMKDPPALLCTTDTPKVATDKFDETNAWNLPVVNEEGKFIGFVSRSGLFNSYRSVLQDIASE